MLNPSSSVLSSGICRQVWAVHELPPCLAVRHAVGGAGGGGGGGWGVVPCSTPVPGVVELENGWVGRVLKGHRAMEDRVGWVGVVLEDCRTTEWLNWNGP